jgi:hypothetical protein
VPVIVSSLTNALLFQSKSRYFFLYILGMVLFLEEDHYVAEDFLYLLDIMQKKGQELCAKCNILSLGTYLKTFNYYTYNNKKVRYFFFYLTIL